MDSTDSPLKKYLNEVLLATDRGAPSAARALKLAKKMNLSDEEFDRLFQMADEDLRRIQSERRRGSLDEALSMARETHRMIPFDPGVILLLESLHYQRWLRDKKRVDEKEGLRLLQELSHASPPRRGSLEILRAGPDSLLDTFLKEYRKEGSSAEPPAKRQTKLIKGFFRQRKGYYQKNSPYRDRRIGPMLFLFALILGGTLFWINRNLWVPPLMEWFRELTQISRDRKTGNEDRENLPVPTVEDLPLEMIPADRNSPLTYHPRLSRIIREEESYSVSVEGFFKDPGQEIREMTVELLWLSDGGTPLHRERRELIDGTSPRYRAGDPLPFRSHTFLRQTPPGIRELRLEVVRMKTVPPPEGGYSPAREVQLFGNSSPLLNMKQRSQQEVSGLDGIYHFFEWEVVNKGSRPISELPLQTRWSDDQGERLYHYESSLITPDQPALYPGDRRIIKRAVPIPLETSESPEWQESSLILYSQMDSPGVQ